MFRKGHVIREEDIPVLLSVGKDHIYIWENNENMLHENDAAQILYDICKNDHMRPSEVKEGKIELIAECDGLFQVDSEKLNAVNSLGEMMIAARHGNFPVKAGDKLAGTRIIPLVIEKEKMERAKKAAGNGPIFEIRPYLKKKAGIVTTGNEVFYGRIQDTFTPVIKEKLSEYDAEIIGHEICDDNHERITAAIQKLLEAGADLILCTGGMSVDPDDRTRSRYAIPGQRSSHTALRCCPAQCSFWPITGNRKSRSWDFRAASCTQNGPYLTWCSPGS